MAIALEFIELGELLVEEFLLVVMVWKLHLSLFVALLFLLFPSLSPIRKDHSRIILFIKHSALSFVGFRCSCDQFN